MVGSLEFATGALKSRFILVLGHTQCGAIKGATATHFAKQKGETGGRVFGVRRSFSIGFSMGFSSFFIGFSLFFGRL